MLTFLHPYFRMANKEIANLVSFAHCLIRTLQIGADPRKLNLVYSPCHQDDYIHLLFGE